MSAYRNRNNRKRPRPSSNNNSPNKTEPPSKKQKISTSYPIPQTPIQIQIQTQTQSETPKSATPPPQQLQSSNPSQNIPSDTSPLQFHNDEEKAEQTDHAIHLDTPTPNPFQNTNTNPSPNTLGHLMTLKQTNFNKKNIINQLTEMKKNGEIPTDLQHQLREYKNRQQIMNKHIKKRFSDMNKNRQQIMNEQMYANIPRPQCQPIITDNDEFDTDESNAWNCNVIICLIFLLIFIICILILNMKLWNNNIIYCNYNQIGNITNCIDCPMYAICENGMAKCKDLDYKLHALKGCLPQDQYYKRINGETLYTQIYDFMKNQRRLYLNCDKNIKYELSKNDIMYLILTTWRKRNSGLNDTELNDALEEFLTSILLEEKYAKEIKLNVSNGTYYADLPEWEKNVSENCMKMNILLMARLYGLELSVSVICVAGLLVVWRQF